MNLGTVTGGVISANATQHAVSRGSFTINDAAIQNGMTYLTAELEKQDKVIREPLTSFTYPRDIEIRTGGGWVEMLSSMSVDYGLTGGSTNGPVMASGANSAPIVQANMGKDFFKTHIFNVVLRANFFDVQRGDLAGRSIEDLLQNGIRLAYDKHMDINVYKGLSDYGTTGILNNASVARTDVATGLGGYDWASKTPDEILKDVNDAILDVWEACGYDEDAIPNHILIPYEQFAHIATQKVSTQAEKTILTFLLDNNIAKKSGGSDLVIAPCRFCKDAGQGGTDRMVVYVNKERYLRVDELVPLQRIMTQPNLDAMAYDSAYAANISEVQVFYNQSMGYFDKI